VCVCMCVSMSGVVRDVQGCRAETTMLRALGCRGTNRGIRETKGRRQAAREDGRGS
jgi:hypothetical protein